MAIFEAAEREVALARALDLLEGDPRVEAAVLHWLPRLADDRSLV